jgi:hypothetical protein
MWMRLAVLAAAIALFAGVVRLSIDRPWKPQGYAGLEFAAMTPAANARTPYLERGGALVSQVTPNSAAARARITPGMVVAQIDGARVASARAASDIIRQHKAGDTIALTLFDIPKGEIHARTVRLAFDAEPPASRALSVGPPRTLAKLPIPQPPIAANAAWSRRIARGAFIKPLALTGLGAGRCNGFAPEGWRVAGHAEDDSALHVMAGAGFLHAVYSSGELAGQDAEGFILDFLKDRFGASAKLTPAQKRPFGFVLQDFGNARGGTGFVQYRVMRGRIALWAVAVSSADAGWARPLAGAVVFSLRCEAPGAPAPLPRDPALAATSVSQRCLQGQCEEGDFAATLLRRFRRGYVHNAKGQMFLVNPRRDLWQTGEQGPGYYRQIGGENEKLEPGRIN